jgi:hypothetical protein
MSYTKFIVDDGTCNYLDSQNDSANKMLRSCINRDYKQVNVPLNVSKGSVNGSAIVEGFASDMGIEIGVSYVRGGICPDSYTRADNGECHKVCSHCKYNDQRGFYGDGLSMGEQICGGHQLFTGVDKRGFIKCIPNKEAKDDHLTNTITKTYNVDSSFTQDYINLFVV